MPHSRCIRELPCRPVHRCLAFSFSMEDDDDTPIDETPSPPSAALLQHHTVPLANENWDMEEIPNRTLCLHEHALPHGLCPYPCPYVNYQTSTYYNTLDISNISEFKDIMTKSSDEDIPLLEDIGY